MRILALGGCAGIAGGGGLGRKKHGDRHRQVREAQRGTDKG